MPTHYNGTPEEILALDTFIKLSRAMTSFETRMLAHGALGKLTLSQFGVLEALYHLGPLCQGQLSQKLLKSTGNMTMVVDNLEKMGLVRRVRSAEDRRMITIELTQTGTKMIENVLPAHVAAIVAEMSVLTAKEQALLSELSRKLGKGEAQAAIPTQPVEMIRHQLALDEENSGPAS
jgi:MarR family transcriptional regulator, 2-MHQ and catechol-resistance regulon repressor